MEEENEKKGKWMKIINKRCRKLMWVKRNKNKEKSIRMKDKRKKK